MSRFIFIFGGEGVKRQNMTDKFFKNYFFGKHDFLINTGQ